VTSSAFETEPPQAVRLDLIFNIKNSAGSSISTVITTIVMETLPDDLYHNDNHMWDVSKRTASSASPGVA
jgi:hypothetical protein